MNITIKINTDPNAFDDNAEGEAARILKMLADKWLTEGIPEIFRLRDINGNIVGSCRCD